MAEPLPAKKYRFITINQDSDYNAKPYYSIVNNQSRASIGCLFWYLPWKQYVFEAEPRAVFTDACLADIIHFVRAANRQERSHG